MRIDKSHLTKTDFELLSDFGCSSGGLSTEAAAAALERFGPHTVAAGTRYSLLKDLAQRCHNPLVIQLLIIATVSYIMQDYRSPSVVGAMVFLSVSVCLSNGGITHRKVFT